jgi:hypothetical protein
MDASVSPRKRRLQVARRKRWRRRQKAGTFVVSVEISARLLMFLVETGRISEAECKANDRRAISRSLAALAEQLVTDWEQSSGRINTG